MNNKLGSEFIEDFDDNKSRNREALLVFSLLSTIIVTIVVMWFELPDIIYILYSILVGVPGVIFGIEADKSLNFKGATHFFFLEKRRVYKTKIE